MTTPRRVLVVDDDCDVLNAIAEILASGDHVVAVAANGLDALRKAFTHRPDVILLDLMMPKMDGWDFRRAQLSDPDLAPIPVVVISAVIPEAVPHITAGNYFLQKPFTVEQLLATVKRFAGKDETHARAARD